MKRIYSALLIAVMLIGMLPAMAIPAFAATSGTTGDCTWTLNGTELTIRGNGAMENYWYSDSLPWGNSITKVTIEEGVTSIGDHAFSRCDKLTSVTIPNSVTSIGDWAFYDCSELTSVTIPNSMTSIGYGAFSLCSGLTSVTIPNSVTSIGNYAFESCSGLTSVTIGNSVTSIGNYAFEGCSGLTSVTIPNSVTSIGDDAFRGCSGLTSLTIPNSVTFIGGYAFYDCSGLTSVTIPNSVTSIGSGTFFCCSGLTSLTIPNSVTSIGYSAFRDCSGLTSLTIPDSVTSIGNYAFNGCTGLTSVYITDIAKWCAIDFIDYSSNPLFYAETLYLNGTLITDLVIPDGVTSIGEYTFSGCSGLTSLTIGNSVTSIGFDAFSYCSGLTSVTLGNGVNSIGDRAFYGCSKLTSLTIPNSVTSIGRYAFSYCSGLTSVTIPNSVTSIGDDAFYNCYNLQEVEWFASKIPAGVFSGCSNLKRIYLSAETNLIDHSNFPNASLRRVFFGGTQEQRQAMTVQHSNNGLDGAKWSYNEPGLPDHTYTNACDKDCNECGMSRETTHQFGPYVYNNDATASKDGTKTQTCSVCGATETVVAAGTKLIDTSKKFTDVPKDQWYKQYVDYAVTHGIFNGTSAKNFSPNLDMTRAQVVMVFANISGINVSNNNISSGFTDVKKGEWYTAAVAWASKNGIVNGVGGGKFAPNAKVTREQMCVMIVNYIENYRGETLTPQIGTFKFADDSKISSWAKAAVYKCARAKLVNGVGNNKFAPQNTATRAQGATLFSTLHKQYIK